MNKLTERTNLEGLGKGIWHEYKSDSGVTYSVVNLGKLMEGSGMPKEILNAMFSGWEAIPLSEDGALHPTEMYRADSWEELEKKIK